MSEIVISFKPKGLENQYNFSDLDYSAVTEGKGNYLGWTCETKESARVDHYESLFRVEPERKGTGRKMWRPEEKT